MLHTHHHHKGLDFFSMTSRTNPSHFIAYLALAHHADWLDLHWVGLLQHG